MEERTGLYNNHRIESSCNERSLRNRKLVRVKVVKGRE